MTYRQTSATRPAIRPTTTASATLTCPTQPRRIFRVCAVGTNGYGSHTIAAPPDVFTLRTLADDIVGNLGAAGLEPTHQGYRGVIVEYFDPALASDDELGAPVSYPILVDASHVVFAELARGPINSKTQLAAIVTRLMPSPELTRCD